MKLKDKTILMISPEPWSHIFVSKHHYAVHLARQGSKVFFLNPPSPHNQTSPTDIPNLTTVDYTGFVKGLRYMPPLMRRWFTKKKWNELKHLCHTSFDVIWSFDSSVFYQLDALPKHLVKIFHLVDLNQDMMVEQAATGADVCFYNSRFIGERLRPFSQNIFFINHGFAGLPGKSNTLSIPPCSGTKAGYAGNLDIPFLDWQLIRQAVASHPEVGFYFAGNCSKVETLKWFEETPNVFWVGKLSFEELSSFYAQMDMLLIAYLADTNREQLANPHKVMEYLASGKPIVATYTAEYADKDLLIMSDRNEAWPELLSQTIAQLEQHITPEKVAARQAFALDNTYDKQIERIDLIISNHQT